jgi:hypothetical protein
MGQIETMMVVVLILLSGLLGILLGGGGAWLIKPDSQDRVVERTVNRYVCSDGSIKSSQNECPTMSADGTVQCPPCQPAGSPTDVLYTVCDCVRCAIDCGPSTPGAVTTTTIAQPVCRECSSNSDCGQPSYDDARCRGEVEYKMYNEPFCDDGCCKVRQTRNDIRSCTENEICHPQQGCVQRE